MSFVANIDVKPEFDLTAHARETSSRERQKSLMLRAWIMAGLFFMALPGTLLGFSNLVAISAHHGLSALSPAWLEGHGHAQLFGWIGSFVLGIGFYSQPTGKSVLRIPLPCFVLWTSGVAMRWAANIYGWHWRTLFLVSASAELLALLLFLSAARHHKLPQAGQKTKPRMELWMISVFLGTAALLAGVIFNFVECVKLAIAGGAMSFPHMLDQRYLVLLGWGFLAPTVWGFSARWLPNFLGIDRLHDNVFLWALLVDLAGILAGVSGFTLTATAMFVTAAILMVITLRLAERPHAPAKVQGIHPSFPVFIRIAYGWLVIAGVMSVWAALTSHP
jgi:hypothetical protein